MVEDGDRLRPGGLPVARLGHRRSPLLALRAAGVPADARRASPRRPTGSSRRRFGRAATGRSAVPGVPAGRLVVRARQRPLSRRGRRGRRRPRARARPGRPASRVERAARWVAAMQSSSGGWGAFDVDNRAEWLYGLPFCDFGFVIDPPSVDVSGHALELLAGRPGYEDAVRRGVEYVLAEQEDDGSWFGRWGVNYVYGDRRGAPRRSRRPGSRPGHESVPPRGRLARARARTRTAASARTAARTTSARTGPRLARARRVDAVADGLGAPRPRRGRRGPTRRRARRAVEFLRRTQRADGDWDEEPFTGTGFPRDFMIRYHLYRIVWPVLALARVRALSRVKVYVTGAGGFVGGHVARELARARRRRPDRARRAPRPGRARACLRGPRRGRPRRRALQLRRDPRSERSA